MNDKKKKLLIVAGCSAAALVLIIAIAAQFQKMPSAEDILPTSGTASSEVTAESDVSIPENTEEKDVIIQPNSTDSSTLLDNTQPQTDQPVQSIQADVSKPKAPEYQADQTENKSQGGLPGFENVPDGGANQVVEGESDGDINKQVGTMD